MSICPGGMFLGKRINMSGLYGFFYHKMPKAGVIPERSDGMTLLLGLSTECLATRYEYNHFKAILMRLLGGMFLFTETILLLTYVSFSGEKSSLVLPTEHST